MSQSQDLESLKQVLQSPDSYKEGSKPFKKGVQNKDTQKITIITEGVQKVIINKFKEPPIMQLNAIRLIKECFEFFTQEFIDMVAEKILPILSQIAHYQQNNDNINRGKEYFYQENQIKDTQLEQIGNSFFRLVLECIYVWAKWYPYTQYAKTYKNLVDQKITFPTQFTYFKAELINSTVDEILQRREEASRIRREQKLGQSHIDGNQNAIEISAIKNFQEPKQQNSNLNTQNYKNQFPAGNYIPKTDNEYQETKTGGEPNIPHNIEENPNIADANKQLQTIQVSKKSLLKGLSSSTPIDKSMLEYFKQEFEQYIQITQFYQEIFEQQEGNETLIGQIFNENQFSVEFVTHCNMYLQGEETWSDLQKVFENQMKRYQQNAGDKSQTIGTIGGQFVDVVMGPSMIESEKKHLTYGLGVKSQNFPTSQNHFEHKVDEDDMEQTIVRNPEVTQDNKKLNQIGQNNNGVSKQIVSQNNNINSSSINNNNNKNLYQSNIAEDIEERKGIQDDHIQQLQPQNYNPSTQQKREEFANYENGRRTLKEALNNNEYEKYKCQLKSKTNFSKLSLNQSNLSNYTSAQKRPQFLRTNLNRESSNLNNEQDQPEDLHKQLQQILEKLRIVQDERDEFQSKYEQSQKEIDRLNQIIQSLQDNNN